MPQIIPIKDLKDTTKVSEMCHKTSEPIFVTKNGYGDMVFMSMDTYERMISRLRLYQELQISETQAAEGKVKDAVSALSDMRAKYGL